MAAEYSQFLKNFNWYHIVCTLADDSYLNMERVLDENVQDCFSYLQYLSNKNKAEEAQAKFEEKINKSKRRR